MRSYVVLAAGALMILSAVAHGALGWPAMQAELRRVGAGPDLAGGLAAGWFFGSAAMACFGVITVVCARRFRVGDRSGVTLLLIVSGCYVIYGLAAMVVRDYNTHFLLFVITGLLVGVPVLGTK